MHDAIVQVPDPINEPILTYSPGSPEKARLKAALADIEREVVEIPCVVGGQRVMTVDEHLGVGTDESEREDQRVDLDPQLAAGDVDELAGLQLDAHAVQRDQLAVLALEARGAEREVARATFLLRR